MTVKQLKEALALFDDTTEVRIGLTRLEIESLYASTHRGRDCGSSDFAEKPVILLMPPIFRNDD